MPVTNEKAPRRRRNEQDRVGERAVPYEVDNPAWQSNSKVGSRYRVETNKATYTWKYKNEGGLTEREIERLPILGSRGDFNVRPISKVVVENGLKSISYTDPNSKKYRYKSIKATEGALRRNNWVIYVQIAIAAANQYHPKQIKYPEAISDLVLQAMFHATENIDEIKEPKPMNPILYIFYNPWSFKQYVAENVPPIQEMVENAMKQNKNFFDGDKSKFFKAWREFCILKGIDKEVEINGQTNWDRFGDHSTDLSEFIKSRNNMIERGVLNPSLRILNRITNAGPVLPGAIPVAPPSVTTNYQPIENIIAPTDNPDEENLGFDIDVPTEDIPSGYVISQGRLIATSSSLPSFPFSRTQTVTIPIDNPIATTNISVNFSTDKLMKIILNRQISEKDIISLYESKLKQILNNPDEAELYFNEMQGNFYMNISEFKKLYEPNRWLSDVNIDAFVKNFNYESLLSENKPYFIGPLGWPSHFNNPTKSDNVKNLLKGRMNWVICPVAVNRVNSHWYVINVKFTKDKDKFDYKIFIIDSLPVPMSKIQERYEESLQKIRQTINDLYQGQINPKVRKPEFPRGGTQKDGSSCGIYTIFTMLLLHNGIGVDPNFYTMFQQDSYIQKTRKTFAGYLSTKLKEIRLPSKRKNEAEGQYIDKNPPEKRRKISSQRTEDMTQSTSTQIVTRKTPSAPNQPIKKRVTANRPTTPSGTTTRPQRTKKLPKKYKEFEMS
jgi:hypothetical protein